MYIFDNILIVSSTFFLSTAIQFSQLESPA